MLDDEPREETLAGLCLVFTVKTKQ